MASSPFLRVSFSVAAWLMQPGMAGHSATTTPSSSRSTVTKTLHEDGSAVGASVSQEVVPEAASSAATRSQFPSA
jgi:hypothetical protein